MLTTHKLILNRQQSQAKQRGIEIDNDGYTKENYIIWAVVERLLNANIEHIYNGSIEYDMNSFYIVNFLNFGTGHFTNLISKNKNYYNVQP